MSLLEQGRLREMEENDLTMVLEWRNQKRVRENMYSNHLISEEEHRQWYATLDRVTNEYLVFEFDEQPVGLSYFNRLNPIHKRAEWGFYLGGTDLPRGTGTLMGLLSLDYGYEQLELIKIYGEVLDYNQASQKLFERLGFNQDGVLRQHFSRDDQWFDVVVFSQLKDEWLTTNRGQVRESLRSLETTKV